MKKYSSGDTINEASFEEDFNNICKNMGVVTLLTLLRETTQVDLKNQAKWLLRE